MKNTLEDTEIKLELHIVFDIGNGNYREVDLINSWSIRGRTEHIRFKLN